MQLWPHIIDDLLETSELEALVGPGGGGFCSDAGRHLPPPYNVGFLSLFCLTFLLVIAPVCLCNGNLLAMEALEQFLADGNDPNLKVAHHCWECNAGEA